MGIGINKCKSITPDIKKLTYTNTILNGSASYTPEKIAIYTQYLTGFVLGTNKAYDNLFTYRSSQ